MKDLQRRDFLKGAASSLAGTSTIWAQAAKPVSLVMDPKDAVAMAAPVQWAAKELERVLPATRYESIGAAPAGSLCIVAAGHRGQAESMALSMSEKSGRTILAASGGDGRGLAYALLELADRAQRGAGLRQPISERPSNKVRSVARLFVSDVEDKPWFNDREMWPQYLTMLATHRFNRFHLALGIGYDFLRDVTDAYFLFAYPFLLPVPGYDVRAVNLADAERDRNLDTLKFISEQAAARGIDFQLGLWMHGYQWIASPRANYIIEGLTAANHAEYCRDALTAVLKACPAISGVTFRIHGESGVPEGNYSFWKTVFDGVVRSGRKVEIDMHTKGINQEMIDVGIATGMPLTVSPKFWAEHMGMPYHQADIRQQEMPRSAHKAAGLMALSSGSRSFTRYGYADLLREDRRYNVVHRVWPGTQRLLLWSDPVTAAGYSRAFGFCGSAGVDLCEPLSFKGRRGSGIAGGRCAYADASLKPRWDWEKYLDWYRVWGRKLYNPDTPMEVSGTHAALASASRILPIVTTAHGPSAANNTYWPEIYTNQPIVDAGKKNPYTDTQSPKIFSNASPFDPQLFSRMNEFADELLNGERSGKVSPAEVASWLEGLSGAAAGHLAKAKGQGADFRRITTDVRVQIEMGRFFAAKFRSGVLYAIHERTGDRGALEEALKAYRRARAAWAQIIEHTKNIYVSDITVGELPWLRGHWMDRLPAIDDDIAEMAKRLESAEGKPDDRVRAAIAEALGRPQRASAVVRHTPPARFQPSRPLNIELSVDGGATLALYYRHVNQAERWQRTGMQREEHSFRVSIPASYTDSPYPLQYYFELKEGAKAWLHPGFTPDLTNQPYFVVRRVA